MHACAVCAPTVGTGAPLFKVSPWALKLWQRTRRGPPPSTLSPTPLPTAKNITRASPGRSRGETWSGREGWIHHNNSCFQITTTWGRVVGYILWVERDRGCSFIYLHSQHWGVCACKRVCVCVTRSVIAHFILTQDRARGHQSLCRVPRPVTPRRVTRAHAEYVKIINLVHQNIVMNVWHAENLIELVWCHSLPPPLLSLS